MARSHVSRLVHREVSCGGQYDGHGGWNVLSELEVGPYATVTINATGHGIVFEASSTTIDANG